MTTPVSSLLKDRKDEVLERWFQLILASYPAETAQFIRAKSDRFDNPVGFAMWQGVEGLFQSVVDPRTDQPTLAPFLDDLIRIRAVQDFAPSKAISFVFEFKSLLRVVLEKELKHDDGVLHRELAEIDLRVDEQALLAFDEYVKCRVKVSELKAAEIRRNTFRLLQQAELICEVGQDG